MRIELAPLLLGSDPEAFIKSYGLIIGSERVIPEEGVITWDKGPKVVRDGIQIELNLRPSATCAALGGDITAAFNALKTVLAKNQGVEVCFEQVVRVSELEIKALSEKSRQFGCLPSFNIYGLTGPVDNGETYPFRSAGGHVHMGLFTPIFAKDSIINPSEEAQRWRYKVDERDRLVQLMDIFVGNTGVLLDRAVGAVERRKNYGKAGEYRLPKHGLEYRTLSNWWLRNYSTFDLVMGLTKLAVGVLHTTLTGKGDLESIILDMVDTNTVKDAIQTNDLALAHVGWEQVKKFMRDYGKDLHSECGINGQPEILNKFEFFVKMVEQHGLERWFPEDPYDHWVSGKQLSFHRFLETQVTIG